MADFTEPNISPEAANVNSAVSSGSFPAKKPSKNNLILTSALILFFLLVLSVAFFAFFVYKGGPSDSSQDGSGAQEVAQGTTEEAFMITYETFSLKSETFAQSINELQIPDPMMEEIRDNQNYLRDDSMFNPSLSFEDMDNSQAEIALKNSMTEELGAITSEAEGIFGGNDFAPRLGNLLELLLYIASLSKSPYLDQDSRSSWEKAIAEGKSTVNDLLNVMGSEYKPEGEKWIEQNVYSREEFK